VEERPSVEIVSVDPSRLDAFVEGVAAVEEESAPGSVDPEAVRSVAREIVADAAGPRRIVAAAAGDRVVAYATWVAIPKLDARRGFAFVDELRVLSAWRRRGIARRLVEHIAEDAAALGLAGVRLLVLPGNAAARRLYASTGFTEHETIFAERLGGVR
jgi:ribosomal protein S18 acetylase RimI-like enzyme